MVSLWGYTGTDLWWDRWHCRRLSVHLIADGLVWYNGGLLGMDTTAKVDTRLSRCCLFLCIYGDHLAWPLVVGALLGKRREEPSPRHLLSFRAPTVPARWSIVNIIVHTCKYSNDKQRQRVLQYFLHSLTHLGGPTGAARSLEGHEPSSACGHPG
jgi:hypothetical protein